MRLCYYAAMQVYSQVSCMDKAFPTGHAQERLLQEGAAAVPTSTPPPSYHARTATASSYGDCCRLGRRSKGDGRWGDGPASDAAGDAAGARPGPAHGEDRAGQQQSHLASVIAKNHGKYGSSIKALRPKPAVAAGWDWPGRRQRIWLLHQSHQGCCWKVKKLHGKTSENNFSPKVTKVTTPLSRQASWHSVQLLDAVRHDGGADEGILRLHWRLRQEQSISGNLQASSLPRAPRASTPWLRLSPPVV